MKGVAAINTLLEICNLSKVFSGNYALKNVSITLDKGVCHGLLGENGAGKSTLIKVLTGLYTPTSGEIIWKGEKLTNLNPDRASHIGIAAVHQELTLVDTMSVSENIWLGDEPRTRVGLADTKAMVERSKALMKKMELDIDVQKKVGELQLAQKQLVEVAKAIARDPDLLILDEGTSALTEDKVEIVHKIVGRLKDEGKTVILISHRMKEVFQFCDVVTVLKDGCKVGDRTMEEVDENALIEMMSGVQMSKNMPPKLRELPEEEQRHLNQLVLDVRDLTVTGKLDHISLQLHTGEVLGIGGLQGHGQVDFINALFGIEKIAGGDIYINGKKEKIRHPWNAVGAGIFLVPQSRRTEGLFIDLSVAENIIPNVLHAISRFGIINSRKEKDIVGSTVEQLQVKAASGAQLVRFLSGGNQQKIALGKWLAIKGKVLMLIEPTRGIDVKTKYEIYWIIRKLTREGYGVLIVTSEMNELIGLSDRVAIFYENRIVNEFSGDEITDINLLNASFGKMVRGA